MRWVYMITDNNNDFKYPTPIYTFKSEGLRDKVLKFLDDDCYDKLDVELDDEEMEYNNFEKWYVCRMVDSNRVYFCELNSMQHNKPKNEYETYRGQLISMQELIPIEQYEKGEEHFASFYKNRWNKIQNKINKLKKEALTDDEVNEWINSFPELIDW